VDIGHRLSYMDDVGVGTHVLTLSGQVTPVWLEPSFGLEVARVINDEYAALQVKYPERFVGAAVVPLSFLAYPRESLD
jgi:predicted TIM-barrel fold metal-dependent hydrolase